MKKQKANPSQFCGSDGENSEVCVSEDADFVTVEALLPKLSSKKVQIRFAKGMLSIKSDSNEKKIFYQVAIPGHFNQKTIPKVGLQENILKVVFTKNKNPIIKKKNTLKKPLTRLHYE